MPDAAIIDELLAISVDRKLTAVTSHKIPFHDVDVMEVAWHGHYAKYFELARCQLFSEIQYDYAEMRDSGFAWPVVDFRVKYIRSLLYNQEVEIHASLVEWEYRVKVNYEIRDKATGTKLSVGHSTQMGINMQTGETCFETPECFRRKLLAYFKSQP